MPSFAENLQALPTCDDIAALELRDASGAWVARIENKPGRAGSVRVYAYLAGKWGGIGAEAAEEGLKLYAEHAADARANPGKHPNIDRLFQIIEQSARLEVKMVPR